MTNATIKNKLYTPLAPLTKIFDLDIYSANSKEELMQMADEIDSNIRKDQSLAESLGVVVEERRYVLTIEGVGFDVTTTTCDSIVEVFFQFRDKRDALDADWTKVENKEFGAFTSFWDIHHTRTYTLPDLCLYADTLPRLGKKIMGDMFSDWLTFGDDIRNFAYVLKVENQFGLTFTPFSDKYKDGVAVIRPWDEVDKVFSEYFGSFSTSVLNVVRPSVEWRPGFRGCHFENIECTFQPTVSV